MRELVLAGASGVRRPFGGGIGPAGSGRRGSVGVFYALFAALLTLTVLAVAHDISLTLASFAPHAALVQ